MERLQTYDTSGDVVFAETVQVPAGYRPYEPPTGYWRDDYLKFLSNLWPSCFCVFLGAYSGLCLPMYLAGQISGRIGLWTTETTIKVYIAVFAACWLIAFIVGLASKKDKTAAIILYYAPYLYAFLFIMYLRFKFVQHYAIAESGIETFFTALLCNPCSLCQMARHQYGYGKRLDGDAQLDGRQIYTIIHV